MDQNRLILFERFHSMDLPAHELHTFNHLLESDATYKREYEHFELVVKCIHRYGELGTRNEILKWHNDAMKLSGRKSHVKKIILYTLLLIGVFALSFFLFYQSDLLKDKRNFKELFGLYPIELPQNNPDYRAIQQAFDGGNIEATIVALNNTPLQTLTPHKRSFYRAVCFLALEEPRTLDAINDLHEVLAVSGPHVDDAHWYLALAYLYENKKKAASSHLEAISADYHPTAVQRFYQILDK
jgi:hypothetical protein